MAGRGNPDGRASNRHLREHVISKLLYNKGIHRKSFRLRLGIKSPQYFGKCMTNPAEHLSVNQIEIIAGVLELPFFEVLLIIRGERTIEARKWYDNNKDTPTNIAAEPAPTYQVTPH